MSSRKRTNKNPKGYGYDYWSRRAGNNGMQGYGPSVKRRTHRLERLQGKRLVADVAKRELDD